MSQQPMPPSLPAPPLPPGASQIFHCGFQLLECGVRNVVPICGQHILIFYFSFIIAQTLQPTLGTFRYWFLEFPNRKLSHSFTAEVLQEENHWYLGLCIYLILIEGVYYVVAMIYWPLYRNKVRDLNSTSVSATYQHAEQVTELLCALMFTQKIGMILFILEKL